MINLLNVFAMLNFRFELIINSELTEKKKNTLAFHFN